MHLGLATLLLLTSSLVSAQEMTRLMRLKEEHRAKQRAAGVFKDAGPSGYRAVAARTPCANGKAGEFSCDKVDLLSFLSHADMGSTTKEGNDVWGWTSPDGREFGAVGQTDGTAFVEVLKDGTLVWLGRLPTQTVSSIWRDIKIIDGFAFIGSEAKDHGLQIFDMRKLLTVTSPKTFSTTSDLTGHFTGFGSSHNIVANEANKMIYAVGTTRSLACKGGLFMVNVSNPANPTNAGCASADGYVHDAQCVFYKGPDTQFNGREICFGFDEDTLTIFDVTSKSSPTILSRTPYNGASYTHQGWLTSMTDMRFLLSDDELDEQDGNGAASNGRTTTFIWDISQLSKPVNTGFYQSPAKAIDHNQYVRENLVYQSNYGSGLRIVNITSIPSDPTGKGMSQAGFFDVNPEDDAVGGEDEFVGSWSVYPFFNSRNLLVNSIERGIFSLKFTG